MSKEQRPRLHGIAEAERLLLVVELQVRYALHELRYLRVVGRPLHDVRVVPPLKLEGGRQDQEHPLEHHVRRLVKEVVVELGGVQQNLLAGELESQVLSLTQFHSVGLSQSRIIVTKLVVG